MARAIAPIAIPNLTVYIVAIQVLCMILIWARPAFAQSLVFDPVKVMGGEWWRVATFLFMPPSTDPIWAAFALYLFWLMGVALEAHWGAAHYTLFLLIAVLMSIGAAFAPMAFGLAPGIATNAYLGGSVFLAFAFLYPDFVLYLFFILPIRIKWLALAAWIFYGAAFLLGGPMTKALTAAAIANFVLFFWHDIIDRARFGRKRMSRQVKRIARMSGPVETSATLHRCVVCGATERSHPQVEFRYCGACGNKCYCLAHLHAHPHATGAAEK